MPGSIALSPRARLQYATALDYLLQRNSAAADRLMRRFDAAFQQITEFPMSGPRDRVPGTRRLVLAPYAIIYRVRDREIEILEIRHDRQRESFLDYPE